MQKAGIVGMVFEGPVLKYIAEIWALQQFFYVCLFP
jgi:hypothetical protein